MQNPHPLDLLVRRLRANAPLSSIDAEAILALPQTVREVPRASYLVREGEKAGYCAVLLDGFAFRHKLTSDGARQIVSVHIPGDALDLQNIFLRCADHNVQTMTNATVALVPAAAIVDLMRERAGIAHAILVNTLIDGSIFREWILNVGRRDARTRLAHLLCEFATRMDGQGLSDGSGYQLPMTQEQLGDALGLTSIHVNRSIRALENDGLVTRRNRWISFPNIDALRREADFSELYLHTDRLAA